MKDFKNNKKVILFTAHPDDHVLCAGTLMKLKDKGFEIIEVLATGGEKSRWLGKEKFSKKDLKKHREKEWVKACKLIGISKRYSLGLKDSETKRDIQAVFKIMKIIRTEKPVLVITHYYNDYHHDHNEVSKLVTEGVTRAGSGMSRELGEPHKTPLFLYMDGVYLNRGDILVDVSDYLEKIYELLEVYKSQINENWKNFLLSIINYRGFFLRTKAAESFEIGYRYPIKFFDNLDKFLEIF